MNYWEFNFSVNPKAPWAEVLMAQLAEIGFESFVDTDLGLQAYVSESEFNEDAFSSLDLIFQKNSEISIQFEKIFIREQNWNAEWESSFEPVQIGQELLIVAPFHQIEQHAGLIIIIEPKMSFGTGHHQTTRLMSKALFELPKVPDNVLDMGSGTGVLAILAEKLGAQNILAIDIEEWAFENALENVERNSCNQIDVLQGDAHLLSGRSFDLILANINKNVLLQDLETYANCLNHNGLLLLSGFFTSDNEILLNSAKNANLALVKSMSEENWSCLQFVKN